MSSEQDRGLAERPSGTVTCLLTDAEGSPGSSWDGDPAGMESALERDGCA